MTTSRGILLGSVVILTLSLVPASHGFRFPGPWRNARATFYGGTGAEGTMGGACGYGNLYKSGYGTMNAAASIAMWDGGGICGSCWEVKCVNNARYCKAGASVVVTVTNQCPQGSEGGWCNRPKEHLDMAYPAFMKIVKEAKVGVVTTQMRRVTCPKRGGVSFTLSGHSFWTQVLVHRVGGSGDLASLEVSQDGGNKWTKLSRNWGSVWSTGGLLGKSLSWRLTSRLTGQKLTLKNCIGKDWYLGGTFSCSGNF